jgi:hypothetical protein
MKAFLPPLDSQWRLAEDWASSDRFKNDSDNEETLWSQPKYNFDAFTKATGISTVGAGSTWVEAYHEWRKSEREARGFDGNLPSGTVLQIERYHVSRSGENQITVKVVASPSQFLTPKKLKGQMRGAGRLYFNLDDFNTLPELEEAHV